MSSYRLEFPDEPTCHDAFVELARFLPGLGNLEAIERRYRKHYLESPLGRPRAAAIYDGDDRKPAGIAALLPARLSVDGLPFSGYIAGDLAVTPHYRSAGPALQLQHALLRDAEANGAEFVYGLPNPASAPVLRRAGYRLVGVTNQHVRLLRADFALNALGRRTSVPRAASRALDLLLVARLERERPRRGGGEIVPRMEFDSSFEPIWNEARQRARVTGERTPDLLNWKYEFTRRSGRFTLLTVVARGRVSGYVVYHDRDGARHVVDLLVDGSATADALLGRVLHEAREKGLGAVAFLHLSIENELEERLRRFGFLRRDGRPLMTFPVSRSAARLASADRWHLVSGDEDL